MMTLRRPPRRGFVGNPFTPAELFRGGVNGVWFDFSDLGTLFQDSAGTIPVTAADQPVGKILDKSGNGNHASQTTGSKRPMLRSDGRLWWLEFDGVDDYFTFGSIGAGYYRSFMFAMQATPIAWSFIIEQGETASNYDGAFIVDFDGGFTGNTLSIFSRSSVALSKFLLSGVTPANNLITPTVATTLIDRKSAETTEQHRIYLNGQRSAIQEFEANKLTAYNVAFPDRPYWYNSRNGSNQFLNHKLYGFIMTNIIHTAIQQRATEKYLATKSGVVF